MDTKKIKEFGKKHWRKAAAVAAGLGVVAYAVAREKKLVSGDWNPISTDGMSNVNWARKWNGNDEWNGCLHACIDNVTIDELCETGKQLLVNAELPEDTKVKAVQLITEGIK